MIDLATLKGASVGDQPVIGIAIGDQQVWPTGPQVLFEDDFTRPNASTLGVPWTEHVGTWGILDNQGRCLSDSGNSVFICAATVDIGQTTKAIEWQWPVISRPNGYMVIRYVDPNNMIFIGGTGTSASTAYLIQRLGGNVTVLDQSTTVTWGDDTLIRAEDNGTGITVSFDGVQKLSASTSQFNTSTRCGIGGNARTVNAQSPLFNTARIDHFRAVELAT